MLEFDYDLFVIGAGSGGVRAARLAAQMGKKVAIAEESKPGGTCVVRGCVPKKYLVYGAEYGSSIAASEKYGWSYENLDFNWEKLRDSIQKEVDRLSGIYSNILNKNGAVVYNERAEFIDKNTVILTSSKKKISAENILIAVGGRPWSPDINGVEHSIISDDAFLLEKLPSSILIIGGGYIASEFAGIFSGLGVKTIQAYRGEHLLKGFDKDIRLRVGTHQKINGIDVRYNISPLEISINGETYNTHFDDDSIINSDLVFMATGRRPYTSSLGLDRVGVKTDALGSIIVDGLSKTNIQNIYAVGDVTNRLNLTPVAIREAKAFIETLYGSEQVEYDHSNIASAVFTRPPIGVVGLNEAQARELYGDDIVVYETSFRPMKNILSGKEEKCFMKLITEGMNEKIVGIHIIGDDSPEIIQILGICVKAGLTKADFDNTCAVHPTLAEEIVTLNARA
ncbi:MAG: glutathione-disulfide reductase [Hellea sp.]|jgi:glutathione reductase (NADPH)